MWIRFILTLRITDDYLLFVTFLIVLMEFNYIFNEHTIFLFQFLMMKRLQVFSDYCLALIIDIENNLNIYTTYILFRY